MFDSSECRAVDPCAAEKVSSFEVIRGEVFMAGDGDEREGCSLGFFELLVDLVGHAFDESGLTAAGRSFEHNGNFFVEGFREESFFWSDFDVERFLFDDFDGGGAGFGFRGWAFHKRGGGGGEGGSTLEGLCWSALGWFLVFVGGEYGFSTKDSAVHDLEEDLVGDVFRCCFLFEACSDFFMQAVPSRYSDDVAGTFDVEFESLVSDEEGPVVSSDVACEFNGDAVVPHVDDTVVFCDDRDRNDVVGRGRDELPNDTLGVSRGGLVGAPCDLAEVDPLAHR